MLNKLTVDEKERLLVFFTDGDWETVNKTLTLLLVETGQVLLNAQPSSEVLRDYKAAYDGQRRLLNQLNDLRDILIKDSHSQAV